MQHLQIYLEDTTICSAPTALRHKDPQIVQPGPTVELRVHRVNDIRLLSTSIRRLQHNDTSNWLCRLHKTWLTRPPPQEHGVTIIPNLEDLKRNRRLPGLCVFELFQRRESWLGGLDWNLSYTWGVHTDPKGFGPFGHPLFISSFTPSA